MDCSQEPLYALNELIAKVMQPPAEYEACLSRVRALEFERSDPNVFLGWFVFFCSGVLAGAVIVAIGGKKGSEQARLTSMREPLMSKV